MILYSFRAKQSPYTNIVNIDHIQKIFHKVKALAHEAIRHICDNIFSCNEQVKNSGILVFWFHSGFLPDNLVLFVPYLHVYIL